MAAMGEHARAMFECKYTPEINYRKLMAIYEHALTRKKSPQFAEELTSQRRVAAGGALGTSVR